jgi:PAS domain S-box-containing protein
MNSTEPPYQHVGNLLALSAELNGAETVETAITRTIELVETAFDQPVASVCTYDPATDTVTTLGSSVSSSACVDSAPGRIPESLVNRAGERVDDPLVDDTPEATVDTDPREPLQIEVLAPVGRDRVLRVGVTELERLDKTGIATVEGIAANLETALSRIDHRQSAAVGCDVARALFDQSDDATFVSDTDGTLVAVNRAAVELTGRDEKALLRSGLPDISGDKAAEAVRGHLDGTVAGASEPLTTTLEHAHEGDLTVELTSQQVDVDGASYIRTIAHNPPPGVEPQPGRPEDPVKDDATALRRLSELTAGVEEFDEMIERLLSLGCDHLGLDTGILSHVDGDDYEVDAVVDATGTHEAGAVYDLGDTMCDATLAGEATESLAFADIEDTDHRNHPAAEGVRAHIAAPVVVDGVTHGTVNFSMGKPRSEAFRPEEKEFVELVAEWIGTEIERRHRFEELERYETIVEAVDDPVYALDTEGRFTYVNEATKRQFGDGKEFIGKRPSVVMNELDVDRVREQIEDLITSDERSTTVEFELKTADGDSRLIENNIAIIGESRLEGAAGVLRDITDRERRRKQLESFQRAVESSRDGVAVLDGDEYEYVDRTHVDMYGFEDKEQLLGSTWRKLYDDEEVERLEAEAFPALESKKYWRGMVTGSRPDGSTFPAELSLTIIDDGRLVCTVRDESGRRKRERELELKERAMDEANVGIQITDPDQEDNPLIYVNDGFEQMTGYAREDALGRNPRFLQGEDSDPEQVARLREAISSEEPVSLELRNERKDGTSYWSRLSVTPVTDESGAVGNYIGIQQDITERRERTQWLQQFLDQGPLMFIQTRHDDGEAVVESCSDRFLDRLGYDRGEIVGEPLASLYTADSAADLRAGGYEDALAGGFELSERALVDADGEPVHTLLRAVPRDDETTGTSALFVDISERRERERQAEARRDFLKRIYEVTTDPERTFEQKITGLLEAGRDHLDLPYGFLTQIETDDEGESGRQTIVEALGSHELLQPGESAPLEQSYCRRTIERDGVMALTNATGAGLADDLAYKTFGLETYIGSKVVAGDNTYGTLCFASEEPRDQSFDEFEQSFIQLVGRWAGYEINRRNTRKELREQRERLDLTLSGTNTGLAEWNVETGAVTWNETLVDIVGRDVDSIEEFKAATHPDDRGRIQRELETMIETGDPWIGEFRVVDDSSDELWLRTRAVPVYDDGGEPVRVLATGTDITDVKERQRELFEERERFRLLMKSVDEYTFVVVDEEGVIQTWNESAEDTFGYDAEAAVGMSIAELHPEADRERGTSDRLLQQARVAGESAHEGWRIRADGSRFYADVRYAPLEAGDETSRGFAMIIRDMTDRRRERRRAERFVEESDDVVTIVDPDGTVAYASGSANRVLGRDPDDFIGENLFDYLHPDSQGRAMEAFFACVEDSEEVTTEFRFDSPDSGWINVEGRCRNMLDDDAIDGMLVYLRDVTAVRERNRRFKSIFNSTFGFTGLLDPDGTVIELNDAALEFGGMERDAIIGNPFFDTPWWTHSEALRDDVRDAIGRAAGGEFVRHEMEARGVDGLAQIDFSLKPVTDQDGDVSLLVVEARNITALQQHKRHLEVMQRVMRHNMRNDLSKMRGWTEIMCKEPDAEKRAEQFETVTQIFDKWTAMTEKMQEIRTVLESQQGREARQEAEALVEDAVAPVCEEYAGRTVVTDVPETGPQIPATLQDVIHELVENAAKASADTIEVEVDRSADGWIDVFVRDDGLGMPDIEADVLEAGEETPLNHGKGLGLWMVRMIVTQAGGDVSVESTGDGTKVWLRLPAKQTAEDERSARMTE